MSTDTKKSLLGPSAGLRSLPILLWGDCTFALFPLCFALVTWFCLSPLCPSLNSSVTHQEVSGPRTWCLESGNKTVV